MNMHITRITNVPPIQHFCFGLIISWFFRRRLVDPSHRNFTSPRFSASRPHCVIPLKRGCGWTEVSLSLRMCHRLKCIQHLLIARALTARTLPLSNPLRNGYIGCNPTDAGQVVLAYLQSGFPSQGHTGNVPDKKPIQLSKFS